MYYERIIDQHLSEWAARPVLLGSSGKEFVSRNRLSTFARHESAASRSKSRRTGRNEESVGLYARQETIASHTLLAREFWKVRLYRPKSRQCRTPC